MNQKEQLRKLEKTETTQDTKTNKLISFDQLFNYALNTIVYLDNLTVGRKIPKV